MSKIVFVLIMGGIIYGVFKLSKKRGIVPVIFTMAMVFAMIIKGWEDIKKIASLVIDICRGNYSNIMIPLVSVLFIFGFMGTVTFIIRKNGYDWKTSISIGGISILLLGIIFNVIFSIINYFKTIL